VEIKLLTLGQLGVYRDGAELVALTAQPVRLALLIYLAIERQTTREVLMACLWPDRESHRARHALSQTLYALRRTLGDGWVELHGERLRVAEWVEVDAVCFASAARQRANAKALALYRGPFLAGWHLSGSAEFERWVETQRAALARTYRGICRRYAVERQDAGDTEGALRAAYRWAEHEPLEAEAQHFLIERLLEAGNEAEAKRQCDAYVQALAAAELEPLADSRALLQRVERLAAITTAGRSAPTMEGARARPPRLVVLPFENLGPSEHEYFTDGITDELTSRISRLPGLAVIARTSAVRYKNAQASIAQVARELDVDYVLEGSVRWDKTGGAAGRVRVSPQLIRAADATHLWAESYEASLVDVFRLQCDIAERVAEALSVRFSDVERDVRSRGGTKDLEAYDLYLLGRHHWKRRTNDGLDRAAVYFQRAIDRDPSFAQAYSGLADTWAMRPAYLGEAPRDCFLRAKAAVVRALDLAEGLVEAHATAGLIAATFDWDWRAAEAHQRRAIELEPNYSAAHVWYAYVLCLTGRPDAARREIEHGHALDPLSVATNWDLGYHGWLLGDRDRAVTQMHRLRELDPSFGVAAWFSGALCYAASEREAARAEWSKVTSAANFFGPGWSVLVDELCGPDPTSGPVDRWVEGLRRPIHWYFVATPYVLLGAEEQALFWLETHCRNVRGEESPVPTGGQNLAYIATDPFFADLRSHPRFVALLERMNLPCEPAPGSQAPADL